jgi:hypothetical protein
LLVGAADAESGRYFNNMAELLKQLRELGEEFLETIKHKTKLSTIFDLYTEKVIPTFVSEKDLKEYYDKKMEEVNDFIDKL